MYRFWSGIYDHVLDVIFRFDRSSAVRVLDPKPGERVLEIGVGTGLNLPLYPKGCKVSAIDISDAMLAKAKEKPTKADVSFWTADARSLPFREGTFDKALATFVLRVTSDPQKVMQELARVVKPGGILVVVDHFKRSNLDSILNPLTRLLGWGRSMRASDLINEPDWKYLSRKNLEKRVQIIKLQRTIYRNRFQSVRV